jgi:serine/threonine-protein kinase
MAYIPKQLGPYHLHEEINAANGVLVYYATDTRTQQDRLLYVLDPLRQADPVCVQRFLAGIEDAAQLCHNHILTIQEYGQLEQHAYAASEPLCATALSRTLRQHHTRLSDPEVTVIVQQVAAALDYAAAHGCLHLALTPEDLWLTGGGRVKVSGFGLASGVAVKQETSSTPSSLVDPLASSLADQTGPPELSPFVAPEQLQDDQPTDQRTDVYRLCAIAYTMMVGCSPFPASEPALLRDQVIRQPPAPPDAMRPDLPAPLVAVLKFGLAKDPAGRYASAGEFAHRLCQAQGGRQRAERGELATHRYTTGVPTVAAGQRLCRR